MRLDLGESKLLLLPPPTYWLFRTNQMLRLVSWLRKTLHHKPIGQRTTSPFSDLLLGSTTVTVLGLLLGAEKVPT
jgi:hypothetical protein